MAVDGFDYHTLNPVVRDCHCENLPEDADTDYPNTAFATFSLATDRATEKCPSAQRLMGLVAHYAPDQIPLWLIPETAMPEAERDDALEVLQRLSLVAYDALTDGTSWARGNDRGEAGADERRACGLP